MPEPLPALLEASVRGLGLVLLAAAALGLGRFTLRVRHEAWTLVAVLFLLLPLSGTLDREVLLPDPAPAAGLEAAPTRPPAVVRAEVAPRPVWQTVVYRHPVEPWQTALVVVWWLGVAASLGHLTLGLAGLRRLRRESAAMPRELAGRIAPLVAGPGLEIRVSELATSPVLLGLRRGLLLLPAAAAGWDDETLRAVVAHELCHRKNRDLLRLLLVRAAACALWFHPGIWWLRSRLAALAERRADEAGAATVGRKAYARCLAAIALQAGRLGSPGTRLALAMASSPTVSGRLRRLLQPEAPSRTASRLPRRLAAAALGLAATGAALPVTPVPPAPAAFHREVARLDSPVASERAEALYRLGRWSGQESRAIPHLVAALGDDAAIETMPSWSFTDEGWAPARSEWWRASPGEVAALSLASMSARAAPFLENALSDPDPVVRRNAAWAVGELRHPRGLSKAAVPRLIRALGDPVPEVRAAAAWSLGDLGAEEALPAVRARLRIETDAAARAELAMADRALREGVSLEAFRHRVDPVQEADTQ